MAGIETLRLPDGSKISISAVALNVIPDWSSVILERLKARRATAYVPPCYLALVHAALGEQDDAFDYLEKAFDMRDGSLPLLNVDQRVDGRRDDSRISDLLWRTGLPARGAYANSDCS